MNEQLATATPVGSELDRLGAVTRRVLWPAGTGRLRTARRVTGVLTVVGSLVQIVVWLLISVATRHLDSPWWLFTTAGGAVVATSLWIVDASGIAGARTEGNEL
jgi:hypothetical protein